MSDMETQVAEVRLEIHSLLLEIEKFMENLADIAHTALPELVYKYPRHHLNKVQVRDQMCVTNSNADHTNVILITYHFYTKQNALNSLPHFASFFTTVKW